jgi:hypothetical protein
LVSDDLAQVVNAVFGEGRDAVLVDAVRIDDDRRSSCLPASSLGTPSSPQPTRTQARSLLDDNRVVKEASNEERIITDPTRFLLRLLKEQLHHQKFGG